MFSKNGGNLGRPVIVAPSTPARRNTCTRRSRLSQGSKGVRGLLHPGDATSGSAPRIAPLTFPGSHLNFTAARLSSVSFDLTPSNVLARLTPLSTTNYDRMVQRCYDIGEYMSVETGGFLHRRPAHRRVG